MPRPRWCGGAIVVWWDNRIGGYDIYGQRVDGSGAVQWTTNGVALCTAIDNEYDPEITIVADGAGGAIFTWMDYRSGTDYDIYAQRVNGSGAVQWATGGLALCTEAGDQRTPTIASDGAGGAIITWHGYRPAGGGESDIYAQRVDASGTIQWTAGGVVICAAADLQGLPTIVSDGSGGAIISWYDDRNGNRDIYAQRVNASGAPQWTANGVPLTTETGSQHAPMIVSDGAAGAIVTWIDSRGVDDDIYVQRVDASGAIQWTTDGVPLCTATDYQWAPEIVSDGAGGAIVTWWDYPGNPDDNVYVQRVDASGEVQWTADGLALCTAAGNQVAPTIASDGSGGAIVAWGDGRSGDVDIYAQRVTHLGNTGSDPVPIS